MLASSAAWGPQLTAGGVKFPALTEHSRRTDAKQTMARPTDYTPELAALICDRLSEEEGGLVEVCKADDMPSRSSVYLWLTQHKEFSDMYARAREDLGVFVAHVGVKEATGAKDAQLGRLQFDARKWLASKLAHKQFGDKLTTELTGADGGPIQSAVSFDPSKLSTGALQELLAATGGGDAK